MILSYNFIKLFYFFISLIYNDLEQSQKKDLQCFVIPSKGNGMNYTTNHLNTGCGAKPKPSFKQLYTKLERIEYLVGKYQHLYHKYLESEYFGGSYELSSRARNWELQWIDLYNILSNYHRDQFNKEQSKQGKALHYDFGDLLA